jgi:ABC-type amino acid transport substrate-binding protein
MPTGSEVNGRWTGMIGDLQSGQADVAFSNLYVLPERQEVVDFIYPLQTVRLG